MTSFSQFVKKMNESRKNSPFYSYTGKGFENGTYVGNPCTWRDDPNAFKTHRDPRAADITDSMLKDTDGMGEITEMLKKVATSCRQVDVPGFETVVVGIRGLLHGLRDYTSAFTYGKAKDRERINVCAAFAVEDLLKGSVPVQFLPPDESERGKPVKGVVVLEGAAKLPDGATRAVRMTVTVSAICRFQDEKNWETSEVYTLHSINVLNPGQDVKL